MNLTYLKLSLTMFTVIIGIMFVSGIYNGMNDLMENKSNQLESIYQSI